MPARTNATSVADNANIRSPVAAMATNPAMTPKVAHGGERNGRVEDRYGPWLALHARAIHGSQRFYRATVALATMATFGVIAGFVAIAGHRRPNVGVVRTLVAFVLAGIVAVIRLCARCARPLRSDQAGAAAGVVTTSRRIQPMTTQ